jgi:hypothetical protein
MMKRIMNEGGLIPYQLTVQVLVNALIANPSKVSQSDNLNIITARVSHPEILKINNAPFL